MGWRPSQWSTNGRMERGSEETSTC